VKQLNFKPSEAGKGLTDGGHCLLGADQT